MGLLVSPLAQQHCSRLAIRVQYNTQNACKLEVLASKEGKYIKSALHPSSNKSLSTFSGWLVTRVTDDDDH